MDFRTVPLGAPKFNGNDHGSPGWRHRSGDAARWFAVLTVMAWMVYGEQSNAVVGLPLLLLLVCFGGIVALVPWGAGHTLRTLGQIVAPVALFVSVQVVMYQIATARVGGNWFLHALVLTIPVTWLAVTVIGARSQVYGSKALHAVVAFTAFTSMLVVLVSYDVATPVVGKLGQAYWAWKADGGVTAASARGLLALRSVGFERDANAFGLVGAAVLAVTLSVPGSRALRWCVGVAALGMVVFSGSRTAWAATLAVAAIVMYAVWSARRGRAVRIASGRTVVMTAAGLTLVVVLSVLFAAVAIPRGSIVVDHPILMQADAVLSARVSVWMVALDALRDFPLGAYRLPEAMLGKSVHNEYLERLILGGPILLFSFVTYVTWMALRLRPRVAPSLGPSLSAVYAVGAFMLGPSMILSYTTLMFYAVGWGQAQIELEDRVAANPAQRKPKKARRA